MEQRTNRSDTAYDDDDNHYSTAHAHHDDQVKSCLVFAAVFQVLQVKC